MYYSKHVQFDRVGSGSGPAVCWGSLDEVTYTHENTATTTTTTSYDLFTP